MKTSLDKNLMKANKFTPELSKNYIICEVVKPVIDIFSVQAELQSVCLELVCKLKMDGLVIIDKFRTQQIIINLIQNAIKFSSPNQTVSIVVEQPNQTPDPDSLI